MDADTPSAPPASTNRLLGSLPVWARGFCWVQPRQAMQERDEPADQLQSGFLDRPCHLDVLLAKHHDVKAGLGGTVGHAHHPHPG
jgi:hypothetical protein